MTDKGRKLIFSAQIEALTEAAKVAIKTKDADAFASVEHQLIALAEDIDVLAALRDTAREVHDQLDIELMDAGLKAMDQSVADIAGSTDDLRQAIAAAKGGKASLFFPKLAKAASQALDRLKDLKAKVEAVGKDLSVATTAELGDVPATLKQLLEDLDAVRTLAQG